MAVYKAIMAMNQCLADDLKKLSLSGLGLTDKDFEPTSTVGRILRQCTTVEQLILSDSEKSRGREANVLTRLPDVIAALPVLSSVTCRGSRSIRGQLKNCGAAYGLPNLKTLILDYNELDPGIQWDRLSTLETLSLAGNNLDGIDENFFLPALKYLDMARNSIPELNNLSALRCLQVLVLYANRIEEIKGLDDLTALTDLDLGFNQIARIGGLDSLSLLKRLSLEVNDIATIEGLTGLRQLEELKLHSNRIGVIQGLDGLSSLRKLDLSSNDISLMEGLEGLSSLEELDLSHNGLTFLEQGRIKKGVSLMVGHNDIREIGKDMYMNHFFQSLDLTVYNCERFEEKAALLQDFTDATFLNTIKTGIKGETRIAEQDLDRFQKIVIGLQLLPNPLVDPPVEVVRQGRLAILNYYEGIERSGTDYLYEAKMLIVGQPRSGKTSLRRKLFHTDALLPVEEETTRGIDIQQMQFDITDTEGRTFPFRYNLWDFGGQQIYQTTHQFFLTHRSLYVLVADTAKDSIGNDDTTLNYWLQIIELLGGDSPVILLKNEKNKRQVNLDLAPKRARFGFLKDDHTVDLDSLIAGTPKYSPDNLKKFQHLKDDIENELSHLPLVGLPMPANWVSIRQRLLELSLERPFIYRNEYIQLCEQYGVDDFDRQMELSGIFHDLGVFLHFRHYRHLEDFIILQNVWATDAVFAVLDSDAVNARKGRFTDSDLPGIWDKRRYTRDIHVKLLSLMMQFELCYELEKGPQSAYIVPEMLPAQAPSGYSWQKTNDVVLYYSYDFMPKGLVTRLIVRLNKFIYVQDDRQLVWKTGVKIDGNAMLIPNTVAEITEAWDNNKLIVRVQGSFPRDLMNRITYDIDQLNADYFRQIDNERKSTSARWHKLIPCNCSECAGKAEAFSYRHERLLKAREMNREVQCQISFEMVSVQHLLDGVFLREKPGAVSGQAKKLFISYSKKDLDLATRFVTHLSTLQKDGQVAHWYCSEMTAGMEWDEKIKTQLDQSDIVCFLVSPDFIGTEYIQREEIRIAFERKKTNPRLRIIPIILNYCQWQTNENNLGRFTALPYTGRPVAAFRNQDEAWFIIMECLRLAIEMDLDPEGEDFFAHQPLSKDVLRIYQRIIAGKTDS